MSAEHERLKEILAEAAAKATPAERAAYLDAACGDDAALRRQVEALLAAHERAGDFLEKTVEMPSSDLVLERTGAMIGRYKVLERIGEGGFGVVFMAEQQEPVQRKVALKIIKAGMDTREVIARFEAERQALALMEHPNIARVLDAGTTVSGRPYFVMELVRGIPITDYCDQKQLSTAERLQLFMQVCHAVQHAHQKGIIHRDLKPTNILVTVIDGVAVPKIIDFGVAKALGQRLTEKTLFTSFQQMIGTPAYMSPEQAELSGVDVDTRSDIYSLGVLLYELLTGVMPFDTETLRKAALDEMRRLIRETEPPKPSTRLRALGEKLTEVAQRRQSEPSALARLVHGDLDWIVMKCLEKERARRYATASAIAADLERYLRHEPVLASPPSTVYRARKFIRRHRMGVAMTVAVAGALVLGVVVSTWQAVRATRAEREQSRLRQQAEDARNSEAKLRIRAEADEKKAETEAARSAQVAQFLKDMLQGVEPAAALGRDTTMLREILDRTAERVSQDLTNQPEVAAQLHSIIAGTYLKLSIFDKAEAMEREALRLRRSVFGETNELVATSLTSLAQILINRRGPNDFSNAEVLARQALAMRRSVIGEEDADVAYSLSMLAAALQNQGRFAEAEEVHLSALAIRRRILKEHPLVASSLNNLARVYYSQGKCDEARARLLESLALQRKLFGEEHPDIADTLHCLGAVAAKQGRQDEAESLMHEALAMERKFFPPEHKQVSASLASLAGLLYGRGRLAEAEPLARKALAICRKLLSAENPNFLASVDGLARILQDQGKLAEAEPLVRECVAITEKVAPDDYATFDARSRLGEVLVAQKKFAEAEPLLLSGYEGLKQREQQIPPAVRATRLKEALQRLVQLYEAKGRADQAAEWKQRLAEFEKAEAEKQSTAPP